MNKVIEYKLILLITGTLFALAWSWLPWVIYNSVVLVTGILPTAGLLGYGFITAALAGGAVAIIENRNPQQEVSTYEN